MNDYEDQTTDYRAQYEMMLAALRDDSPLKANMPTRPLGRNLTKGTK